MLKRGPPATFIPSLLIAESRDLQGTPDPFPAVMHPEPLVRLAQDEGFHPPVHGLGKPLELRPLIRRKVRPEGVAHRPAVLQDLLFPETGNDADGAIVLVRKDRRDHGRVGRAPKKTCRDAAAPLISQDADAPPLPWRP